MPTEDEILAAYQECAKAQVQLLKLEKQHQDIASKIAKCRQDLAVKKSKLADFHRDMSGPLLPVLENKIA